MYDREIAELAAVFEKKLGDEEIRRVFRESLYQYREKVMEGTGTEYPIRTFYIRKEAAIIAAKKRGIMLYE